MTAPTIRRRLTVLATRHGFTVTSEYQNGLGYWNTLSTTTTERLPLHIVARVAERDDFTIYIRALAT